MAYADANDVAVELGRPASSSEEGNQWEAWLERVERTIERRFRRAGLTLSQQVALGDPTTGDVADIEIARVIDKIKNPNTGQTSVTRTIDDGSITYRREGEAATLDALELTDAEWEALLPATTASAFSTRPGFMPDCAPYGFVS